ncbi:MAG: hypothetical protein LBC98_07525 [Prevotellaceae bacterium]|nr:hypothetical protein [Prevotellaceae bacterium]
MPKLKIQDCKNQESGQLRRLVQIQDCKNQESGRYAGWLESLFARRRRDRRPVRDGM